MCQMGKEMVRAERKVCHWCRRVSKHIPTLILGKNQGKKKKLFQESGGVQMGIVLTC